MNKKILPARAAKVELTLLLSTIFLLTLAYLGVRQNRESASVASQTSFTSNGQKVFDNTFGVFRGAVLASYDNEFPLLNSQIKQYEIEKGLRDGIIVLIKKGTKVLVLKRDKVVSLVEVQVGEHATKKLYVLSSCLREYQKAIQESPEYPLY
ncbi:hypothetical protein [Telluribacter sp.]|jgi:hypothetical protein|uniref:hypothetical protein n=1 Tax=Telluribacter sp. TaxID=1978767 RepID=UPI002E0D197E|nr:hypothetical protein [Telluribacter sp.]